MSTEVIPVESIDTQDNRFKISKNIVSAELISSVKVSGILRAPFVMAANTGFCLVTGHNRIAAAKISGLATVPVFITNNVSQTIMNEAALKSFNGEIGPSGKLAALSLMRNEFNMDANTVTRFGRDTFAIPEWVFADDVFISNFKKLHNEIKDYFDIRDISFKQIKSFLGLPLEARAWLGKNAAEFSIGLNIFKKMMDLLIDITRRDGHCNFLSNINADITTGRGIAQELLQQIFELRYPEYSSLKKTADSRLKDIQSAGVLVDFPEFFEGGEINIRIPMKKKEGADAFFKKAQKVSKEELQKLLDML